jgi:predicted heme/steroid binding protein/uncharacterized membrane protein
MKSTNISVSGFVMKKSDFQQFSGKDGKPSYIAYRGHIYNVSKSKHWENGNHMNSHMAGEDLTDALYGAPHGEEVLEKLEKVGILEEEIEYSPADERKEGLRDLYRKFHPHPILIHFPIGSLFLGAALQFLFLITRNPSLENAAFYAFVFGTLFELPAVASGIISWWVNYDLTLISIFRNKLIFSIILLVTSCFIVILRFCIADISFQANIFSLIYNIAIFSSIIVLAILGYYGGKITWY